MSDYSLQLSIFFKNLEKNVLYCADRKHTKMEEKCNKNHIDFLHIPLTHSHPVNIFVSLYNLLIILIKQKKLKYIFVFEGREHTLIGLIKLLCPFLWKRVKLIRIRGQAQTPSKSLFSYLLYRYLTDKTIYTARIVKNRMPFILPHNKIQICYYGKTTHFPKENIKFYHLKKFNYDFHFDPNILTFLTLGRFDPVKGHDYLIESFLSGDFKETKTQLICIGTRESVSAHDLFHKYKHFQKFTDTIEKDGLYVLSNGEKKLILLEYYFSDALLFMKNSSFGIIPSLGSETICRVGVEFLQAGIPVLYSDAGALPEVFSDSPEYKFTAGNVKELTQKLELAFRIFHNDSNFLSEKTKAHEIWKDKFQYDIYRDIMLPG